MGTGNIAQLKSIFLQAQELEAHQVRAYLDEACIGKPALRARAEAMLKQSEGTETELLDAVESGLLLAAGRTLAERFRVVRFVGKGGMGEVYLADDLELGGQVALKTVRARLLAGGNAMGRFRREVQISRQVTHSNICRVFDVGHELRDGEDFLFLTMEFLEGETLGDGLKARGKFSLEAAESLLRQIASGLDALHAQGIMHRDLKPANVMLVGNRAVIMDFGLARAFDATASDPELTQTGAILGTPAYMSPEQQTGGTATAASDIYAFGLVMYEMLLGRKPTLRDSFVPGEMGLTPEWERRVLRCLARDPANRPPTAIEALNDVCVEPAVAPTRRNYLAYAAVAAVAIAIAFGISKLGQAGGGANINQEIAQARSLLFRYFKPGNIEDAARRLEEITLLQPGLAVGHAALAEAYLVKYHDTKKVPLLDLVQDEANRAVQLDPKTAVPHATLGFVFVEKGELELAGTELMSALQLDARNAETQWGLAQLYKAQGRRTEMDAAIQKAIDLAPEDWRYRVWLGGEFRNRRNFDAAIAQYKAAALLMPENPMPLTSLGLVYFHQERLTDAEAAWQESLQLDESASTLSNLGMLRHRQGKYADASAFYERSLKLSGANYLMWADLAAAQEMMSGGRTKALGSYRKAIDLAETRLTKTPNDSDLLSDLASYRAAVGEKNRAIVEIRKAIAISPENPDVARRAAKTYEILHLRNEALRWTAKALDLGYSLTDLRSNADLAGLRADPRYIKLEAQFKKTHQ